MITILDDCIVLNQMSLKEANTRHYWPQADLRLHLLHETCWCRPRMEIDDFGYVCIHNALDGREAYLTGERKLS